MIRRLTNAALAAIALALPAFAPANAQQPTRFTATVTGKGPDVILIPGLASSGATYDATVKQLSPTHRVHVLQVAGFAGAPAGANGGEGAMLPALVDEVAAYAAKLNKPAIIGHSLGGLVAMEVAAAQPGKIDRVMIVDALPFYGLLGGPQMTVEMFKPQATMMRTQVLAQSAEAFAAGQKRTAASLTKSEAGRAAVEKWSTESDRAIVAKAMYEDAVEDARPKLPAIKAKTTVLYAYDTQQPYPQKNFDDMYALAYAGLPGAKLKRVDGSFHFIMLDQPDVFAKEVEAFLK
jgi:pimeloyl-ACP methyl ester carboxylesterase